MAVKIYEEDTVIQIAKKIWEHFELFDSCTVYGFVKAELVLIPKGEAVMMEIRKMYEEEHMRFHGTGKNKKGIRINIIPDNTVGGYIAHKIFKWDKKIVEKEPRFIIWRIQ